MFRVIRGFHLYLWENSRIVPKTKPRLLSFTSVAVRYSVIIRDDFRFTAETEKRISSDIAQRYTGV
jgi:hypothetical protein